MANLKFDRIFGASAKSTQEFTDTEYSRGWGFLGQEPPPYELFDDFFKKTDLKLKDLNDRQLAADSNVSKHNTSSSAHADIRTKITNDINAHNTSSSAHDNQFNAIIQQVNNMITNVDNTDVLAKATSLQLVKALLSNLKIKDADDVIKAIESKKTELGIRFDFSNLNSWYICLGKQYGNYIIQGGRQQAGEQKQSDINNLSNTTNRVVFPISFTTGHLFHGFGIIASDTSIFWGNSGASVVTRKISNTDMRYEVHSTYQTMLKPDSIIEWCVVGV